MKMWVNCDADEFGTRTKRVCEAFNVPMITNRTGVLIWATADEPAKKAIDYREFDWPDEFTLCFGPDYRSAEPLIHDEDARITIPGLRHSLFCDQAMAILLHYLKEKYGTLYE